MSPHPTANSASARLRLTVPDDWHLHLRDGERLAAVLPASSRRFARAVVMPNLDPPIRKLAEAKSYRERILAALPPGLAFEPLMTLYLTTETPSIELAEAAASGLVVGVKYYPAGATTHSQWGIQKAENVYPQLALIEELDLPLLVHAEVVDEEVDIFDRERVFLERELAPVLACFPALRVVVEHLSSAYGVEFVRAAGPRVGATLTAHHLLANRNHMLAQGIDPFHYCAPTLKRRTDQEALVAAAISGSPQFFLGTDSAPHPAIEKLGRPGRPGIYTAHAALELYAECFERVGALDRLEAFASFHGADFYRRPRNQGSLELIRNSQSVPRELPFGDSRLVPFRAGGSLAWSLACDRMGEGP